MTKKVTYLVKINWKGEIHPFHTTTTTPEKALANACHKLGRLTHISGNYIHRQVYNTTKVSVTPCAA